MAPILKSFGQLAVAGLALLSHVAESRSIIQSELVKDVLGSGSSTAAKVPLRLMPLGASITEGQHSSDGNGYRQDLRNLLIDDGYTVDMVGSRKDGNMGDNEDEGWSGFRIEQVEGKARLSVPSRLPNLFTINAGTNDCGQNFKIDTAGQRMDSLLEYLWGASPNTTIILSTLLINLNKDTESRVLLVNDQFRNLITKKQGEGKAIVLAEMHSTDGPQKGDMADDTHPSDVGYNKMAVIWNRSIQDAADKGFLQPPKDLPSP